MRDYKIEINGRVTHSFMEYWRAQQEAELLSAERQDQTVCLICPDGGKDIYRGGVNVGSRWSL